VTQWAINHIEWVAFLDLREKVFKAIKENLEIDSYCKPYGGRFEVTYALPSYFEEREEEKAEWRIRLTCYLVGPNRGGEWCGETFGDALFKAERDINEWLKDHEEWLERVKNDPDGII